MNNFFRGSLKKNANSGWFLNLFSKFFDSSVCSHVQCTRIMFMVFSNVIVKSKDRPVKVLKQPRTVKEIQREKYFRVQATHPKNISPKETDFRYRDFFLTDRVNYGSNVLCSFKKVQWSTESLRFRKPSLTTAKNQAGRGICES